MWTSFPWSTCGGTFHWLPTCRYQTPPAGAISREPAASFDLIIALDVLEHVRDLPETIDQLLRLLRPGRELVVSGPTESMLYQFGRKLAGPEYSGEYHERGVAEIRQPARGEGQSPPDRDPVLAGSAV